MTNSGHAHPWIDPPSEMGKCIKPKRIPEVKSIPHNIASNGKTCETCRYHNRKLDCCSNSETCKDKSLWEGKPAPELHLGMEKCRFCGKLEQCLVTVDDSDGICGECFCDIVTGRRRFPEEPPKPAPDFDRRPHMPDLSLRELSEITGRHVETLRRLARTNQLPGAYKLGRRWMITPEAVRKLRRLEAAPAPETGVSQ